MSILLPTIKVLVLFAFNLLAITFGAESPSYIRATIFDSLGKWGTNIPPCHPFHLTPY